MTDCCLVPPFVGNPPLHRKIPPPVTSELLSTIENEMRSLETLIGVKKSMWKSLEKDRDAEVARLHAEQVEEEKAKNAAKARAAKENELGQLFFEDSDDE